MEKQLEKTLENLKTTIDNFGLITEDKIDKISGICLDYLKSNIDSEENIAKLISQFPRAIYLLEWKKNDGKFFCKLLLDVLDSKSDFMNTSIKKNEFLTFHIAKAYFYKYSHLISKETFKEILKIESHPSRVLTALNAKTFMALYDDPSEFVDDIHNSFYLNKETNSKRYIPSECLSLIGEHLNHFFYHKNKKDLLNGNISYLTYLNDKKDALNLKPIETTIKSLFGQFMTEEDVVELARHVHGNNIHSFLQEYEDFLSIEKKEEIAIDAIKKMKYNKTKLLLNFDQSFRDNIAERIISFNPVFYLHLSKIKRKELINLVDFEKLPMLLNKHPSSSKVSKETWLKAMMDNVIQFDNIPDTLISGDNSFTNDEWIMFFKKVKSVKNSEIITFVKRFSTRKQEIVRLISSSENVNICNKEYISNFLADEKRRKKEAFIVNEAIDVAHTGNERELGKEIIKLFNNHLGTKNNLEKILKEFKR